MLSTWPRITIVLPRGSPCWAASTICCTSAADGRQVAALHVGEDVVDRLDVVVVDVRRLTCRGVQVRQVAEQLGRLSRASPLVLPTLGGGAGRGLRVDDRRVHQGVDRVDAVLRRLHGHAVVDAVRRVDPEVGRHLAGRAERHQHAAGHVLLGQPQLATPWMRSTLRRRSGRSVIWWRWTSAMPGTLAISSAELLGDGEVGLAVDADHLHVDRSGQAEVEDLAGDVRRLEEERAAREPPRQLVAQPGDVVRGRPVVRLQRHQDLAVGVADRAVVDVRP